MLSCFSLACSVQDLLTRKRSQSQQKWGFPSSVNQDNHHRHAQRLDFQVILDFVKTVNTTHFRNCGWLGEGVSGGDQGKFLT